MRGTSKIKRNIREIETYVDDEDNVFYSFRYEYVEHISDGSRRYEALEKIQALVKFKSKEYFFTFEPASENEMTYGTLSITPNNSKKVVNPSSVNMTTVEVKKEKTQLLFSNLDETTLFTNVLKKVHTHCLKIVSKFKDSSNIKTDNSTKEFFA
jgi:hypothetical protein